MAPSTLATAKACSCDRATDSGTGEVGSVACRPDPQIIASTDEEGSIDSRDADVNNDRFTEVEASDFGLELQADQRPGDAPSADERSQNPTIQKPRLHVEKASPDRTVEALRDILARTGVLFDRGIPVRLAFDQTQAGASIDVVTTPSLILLAHANCRPYAKVRQLDGSVREVDVPLPANMANMYLRWRGEWHLPILNGIASSPLLQGDGSIRTAEGYDRASGMWCERVPDIGGRVEDQPTKADAEAALRLLRETFRTFCFSDGDMVTDPRTGDTVVDITRQPGADESAFLVGLLTAVCRPSLPLAPGLLLRAASISGAGAGKGLLARCICAIAFGRPPHAVTVGATPEELEKRIAAELMQGSPSLFIDNLNHTALKSDLLASAITERPARVRVLGRSEMVPLNANAFIVLTGNGLTVSEDLARRFIAVDLDPRTENPELRSFTTDILARVNAQRRELLSAILTIWRWGRQNAGIPEGKTLGSFEQWGRWVRDPLLALGCRDPADRVSEAKENDRHRGEIVELFNVWQERHGVRPVAIRNLHEEVVKLADPQGRGRQFLAAKIAKLEGTRLGGRIMTRQASAGNWGVATYALTPTVAAENHRGDRGHRPLDLGDGRLQGPTKLRETAPISPTPPMPPMPNALNDTADDDQPRWRRRI